MRQGLAAYQATGATVGQSLFLGLLADVYGKAGRITEGLQAVTEARSVTRQNGQRVWEAWLEWLTGELTLRKFQVSSFKFQVTDPRPLAPDPQAEAEGYFLKAIEIARRQQAKSLELRATISLVRLQQQQVTQYASRNTHHETRTRLDAARNMLSEIYGWFTEGFHTPDLREAKLLLEELNRAIGD
jgi:predicted ATPase